MAEPMVAYSPTRWVDHEPDIQQGTPLNAENFNHLEGGTHQANIRTAILEQEVLQHQRIVSDMELEIGTVELKNTQQWPFNNSEVIVVFQKEKKTLNYRVHAEIKSANPNVGDILVYDKQVNGFKLAYSGSAPSATIHYFVQGGFEL